MAKKQTQKKNGRKKQAQSAPFKLGRQGAQAQGAVAAGASDAFEPEQTAQAKAASQHGGPEAKSAPVQETGAVQPISFSFSFNVPKKQPPPDWQAIMVRVVPEDGLTLQALADAAGLPLAAFCRTVLHSAAQQAREQGVA